MSRPEAAMQVLVVHESLFGNTAQIAERIAAGLGRRLLVRVVEVEDAPEAVDGPLSLVVAGGPTHSVGMSRPSSRRRAALVGRHPAPPPELGLREWLAGARFGPGVLVATFDTRLERGRPLARHAGPCAAEDAADRLLRAGLDLLAPPEGFTVRSAGGPLLIGELERAAGWGEHLARLLEHA